MTKIQLKLSQNDKDPTGNRLLHQIPIGIQSSLRAKNPGGKENITFPSAAFSSFPVSIPPFFDAMRLRMHCIARVVLLLQCDKGGGSMHPGESGAGSRSPFSWPLPPPPFSTIGPILSTLFRFFLSDNVGECGALLRKRCRAALSFTNYNYLYVEKATSKADHL